MDARYDSIMEYKSIRVIISGGGTGGHIFPAVSIANKLKELNPATEILFVGAEGKMEMEKVPAEGYRIKGLPMVGMQRQFNMSRTALPALPTNCWAAAYNPSAWRMKGWRNFFLSSRLSCPETPSARLFPALQLRR